MRSKWPLKQVSFHSSAMQHREVDAIMPLPESFRDTANHKVLGPHDPSMAPEPPDSFGTRNWNGTGDGTFLAVMEPPMKIASPTHPKKTNDEPLHHGASIPSRLAIASKASRATWQWPPYAKENGGWMPYRNNPPRKCRKVSPA